jgi:hypothetical protein
MSIQPAKPTKPETKPEKNMDKTALLSPDELRAISGGVAATQPPPPTSGGSGGVQPNTKGIG